MQFKLNKSSIHTNFEFYYLYAIHITTQSVPVSSTSYNPAVQTDNVRKKANALFFLVYSLLQQQRSLEPTKLIGKSIFQGSAWIWKTYILKAKESVEFAPQSKKNLREKCINQDDKISRKIQNFLRSLEFMESSFQNVFWKTAHTGGRIHRQLLSDNLISVIAYPEVDQGMSQD